MHIASTPIDYEFYFQPAAVAGAAEWLSGRLRDDDVVIATMEVGNRLARYGRGRAYVAHPITTVDYGNKLALSLSFLSGEMPVSERETFLRANGIDYVLVGPAELELGAAWVEDAPYLAPFYGQDGVAIYRVVAQ